MLLQVEETTLVFKNKLIYRAPRGQNNININNSTWRYLDLDIDLSCTILRRGNSSLVRLIAPINADEAGTGHLKVSLEMHNDSNFNIAYDSNDFPVMIDEGQDIFLAASLNNIQDVVLSLEVCKVTPTRDPDDEMRHVIMENG